MAITSAVSDFFASIYKLVSSVFGAADSVVHSVFLAAYNFVTGIFSLVGDVLGGFVDISTGVGKFIVGMCQTDPCATELLTRPRKHCIPVHRCPGRFLVHAQHSSGAEAGAEEDQLRKEEGRPLEQRL